MEIKREQLVRQVMVTATIKAGEVKRDTDAYYREHIAPDLELPGFRKGNVPRSVADKKLSADIYRPVVGEYFRQLIASVDGPAGHGDMGMSGATDGSEDLSINCTVSLMPRVLSLDLDKVTSTKYKAPQVSEEDVDVEVATRCKSTVPIQDGESVADCSSMIVDFEGKMDGTPFDGGKAADFKYIIGQTSFIAGFEEQMLAMRVGDAGEVNVTFPDNYPQKALAGKPAVFDVVIKSAEQNATNEPTDESAKAAGFESLDALREKIRTHLAGVQEHGAQQSFKQAIQSALLDAAECETLPNHTLDALAESAWTSFLKTHEWDEEVYVRQGKPAYLDKAKEALRAKYQDSANGKLFDEMCMEEAIRAAKSAWKLDKWKAIKIDAYLKTILHHIAEQQKLTATDEDVAAHTKKAAMGADGATERLSSDAEFRKSMHRSTLYLKAFNWILKQAGLSEKCEKE